MDTEQNRDFDRTVVTIGERSYSLRPISMDDIGELHELDKLCFSEKRAFTEGYFNLLFLYHKAFGWALIPRSDNSSADHRPRKSIQEYTDRKIGKGLGPIAAFVLITMRRHAGNIATLDVHPFHRRSGLGTYLMSLAEEEVRKKGSKRLTLQVAISNQAAISLYFGLGYTMVKKIKNYYGGEEDCYLMEKALDGSR